VDDGRSTNVDRNTYWICQDIGLIPKFLDIEYQTYGWVWAEAKENEEHFTGNTPGKKAICIWQKAQHVLGINTFGIRMRHEFFDAVLTKKETVDYVIANLKAANFDPELFTSYSSNSTTIC
jgi:hypothetical protein